MISRDRLAASLGVALVASALGAASLGRGARGQSARPAGAQHTVELTEIEFRPNRLRVAVGDSIRFINRDRFKHDVYLVRAADPNQVLVSPTQIPPGGSVSIRVEHPGLYSLFCTIHGGMTGKITTTGSFELTESEKRAAARIHTVPPIAKEGERLFWSRGQCHRCHRMGERGTGHRGPNLKDIGFRSSFRAKELGLASGTAYLIQSLLEPSAYVVGGFSDDMPKVYQRPIGLTQADLKAVIAYLQSRGGTVDTWAIDLDPARLATKPALNPFRRGDPGRGRQVFQHAGCGSCHAIEGHPGNGLAPDLTEIGAFRNWTWLAESVIDPNAEIGANWQNVAVFLKPVVGPGGFKRRRTVSGILRKSSAKEVAVLVGPDRIEKIDRAKVDRVVVDDHSRMPENFATSLTFQDMADLVHYLEAQRPPAAVAPPTGPGSPGRR